MGSPYYIAPEVFQGDGYDHRCDLWSVGVLLYYMLSRGSYPFKGDTPDEIFQNIKKEALVFDGQVWENVSQSAKDLTRKLLVKCPDVRIKAEEALRHPFLSKK